MSNLIISGAVNHNGVPVGGGSQVVPVLPIAFPERRWNFDPKLYTQSGSILIVPGCFCIMITNTGSDTFRVNNMVFYPGTVGTSLGDSRTFSGHLLDFFAGNLQLSFATAVAPECEVVQSFYLQQTR